MSSKPLRMIESVPVPMERAIVSLVGAGYCAIGAAFAVLFLGGTVLGMLGSRGDLFWPAVVASAVTFPIIAAWLYLKGDDRHTYTIYPDRVEIVFGERLLVVKLSEVSEVKLTRSLFERRLGLASVTLTTEPLFAGPEWKFLNGRVPLAHLPRPDEVFELIQSLTSKSEHLGDRPSGS